MSTVFAEPRAAIHEMQSSRLSDHRDLWIAVLIGATTFAYLLPFYRFILLNADEGVVLQGAQRVLDGQVPYRDFFSFLPPLSFYWTAALLKSFGDSILSPRAALLIYGAGFASLTYLLTRRAGSRPASLLAAYICAIISLPTSFYVQHNWESTLFAILALFAATHLLDSPSPRIAALLGVLTSLTLLTNQAKGAGLALGVVLAFALLRTRIHKSFRTLYLPVALGFISPLAVTAIYFAAHGALAAMVADVLWPLRHYSAANSIPYGYITFSPEQFETMRSASLLMKIFFALTLSPMVLISALPIFGIMIWLYHVLRPQHSPKAPIFILQGSILFGLWLSFLAGRRDPGHVIYMLPLFAIIIGWILGADLPLPFLRSARPLIVVGMLTVFSLFGFTEYLSASNAHDHLSTRRGLLKTAGSDTVFPYLQAHLRPGDKLFVYPYQPLYNFLTATTNPTAYDFLQPGLHSGDQISAAIAQLERDHTPAVLFTPGFNQIIHIPWPNTPLSVVGGKDAMADYLVRHYRTCASLRSTTNGDWVWLYMARVGTACPANSSNGSSLATVDGAR